MPKRKVEFSEKVEVAEASDGPSKYARLSDGDEESDEGAGRFDRMAKKPSHRDEADMADSGDDDSDEGEGKKRLNMDNVEGQEEGTIDFDGDIRITAFNLKEEEEEGYFDSDGHFHFNPKEDRRQQDQWLEDIDWDDQAEIAKAREAQEKRGGGFVEADEEEAGGVPERGMTVAEEAALYVDMVKLMQPGENVLRALKRLGGGKQLSASERLKLKKAGKPLPGDAEGVKALTGLADSLMSDGDMNIYEETFESLTYRIKKEDADVDMFKEEVMWVYKEGAEIQGPVTTSRMQAICEADQATPRFVKKQGGDSFYPSNRIDFSLYD